MCKSRGREAREIKHNFCKCIARRRHAPGRRSIHGLSASPDGGSLTKKYHRLEGPPIGHLAEKEQKVL
jgi:hypothetical protein